MKAKPKKINDRATTYALSVISGEITAGPIVRGSCQRHLNDLEHGHERGLYYDEHAAAEAIAFFEECLCLNGGQFEGKPFLLFPWEAFVIGSIFGWKRKSDNMRRFRVAYIETPKGSGKSPLAAGIGIKGLVADNEPRAQIYA
ncbi:MAG TPA: terminase large subunit, partial [Syntrophales bacterium]